MKTKNYLQQFFEEKEIRFQIFEIKDKNNTVHFIDTNVVIESIKDTSAQEQEQIATILRKIDFKNGSVSHFLKYLAQGLVKKYAMAS